MGDESVMKNRVLKVLACSIAAVLALGAGLVLGACSGPSPEELIREDLTANLDRVKELDDATVEELVGSMGTIGLEDLWHRGVGRGHVPARRLRLHDR